MAELSPTGSAWRSGMNMLSLKGWMALQCSQATSGMPTGTRRAAAVGSAISVAGG